MLNRDNRLTGESPEKSGKNGNNTGPHRVRMENWIDCSPFEKLLNIEILEASGGKAVLKMPFLYDFAQANGFVHGGALVSLADTAIVMAVKSLVPPKTLLFTVSMEVKFLQVVKNGLVTARAEITGRTESEMYGKAILTNAAEKPAMEVTAVFRISSVKKPLPK
jgi:acyl-CoA thioesterase